MDEHPLVRFVDGPPGRRARLVGTGSDVCEVIAAVKDNDGDIAQTASHLPLSRGLVQAAVAYYGAFVDEIDDWIERNEHEATRAHSVAGWPSRAAALKLLLDEMLSAVIAEQLRAHGHDVEAINRNPLHEMLSDREVLEVARAQRRAIVTNNLVDFRVLHHEAITPGGPDHFGMIFMAGNNRRTKADTGRIVTGLQAKLAQYLGEDDLVNGEAWL